LLGFCGQSAPKDIEAKRINLETGILTQAVQQVRYGWNLCPALFDDYAGFCENDDRHYQTALRCLNYSARSTSKSSISLQIPEQRVRV